MEDQTIQTAIPEIEKYTNKQIAQMALRKLINHLISRKTIAWLTVLGFTTIAYIMDSPFFETIFTYGFVPLSMAYIGSDVIETGVHRLSRNRGGGVQGE
jgi:hypothetical protein